MTEAQQTFDAFATRARTMTIGHVWRGHGSAIFLELGALTPHTRRDGSPGIPGGQLSLGVEWSWRLEDATRIVCGSWSDEPLWQPAFDQLKGSKIRSLVLFGSLPEIALETEEGLRFLSFSTTDGDPQWYLIDRSVGPVRSLRVRNGQLQIES